MAPIYRFILNTAFWILAVLSFVVIVGVAIGGVAHASRLGQIDSPTDAMVERLSYFDSLGDRQVGGPAEQTARSYIANAFRDAGYDPQIQEFTLSTGEHSANIIVTKSGRSEQRIYVGAHYDSGGTFGGGTGAADNGSGVAVLLALAEQLHDVNVPYTIEFIAFGAEEAYFGAGDRTGSRFFVQQEFGDSNAPNVAKVQNAIGVINLDTLIAGDRLYVSSGKENANPDFGWIRDQMLDRGFIARTDIHTNPGLNAEFPYGTTGEFGDSYSFEPYSIPWVTVEQTNWNIGERDGYEQTLLHGKIWNTSQDTLAIIQRFESGAVEKNLENAYRLLYVTLMNLNPPINNSVVYWWNELIVHL